MNVASLVVNGCTLVASILGITIYPACIFAPSVRIHHGRSVAPGMPETQPKRHFNPLEAVRWLTRVKVVSDDQPPYGDREGTGVRHARILYLSTLHMYISGFVKPNLPEGREKGWSARPAWRSSTRYGDLESKIYLAYAAWDSNITSRSK